LTSRGAASASIQIFSRFPLSLVQADVLIGRWRGDRDRDRGPGPARPGPAPRRYPAALGPPRL